MRSITNRDNQDLSERVARAIEAAQKVRAYGLYDYSNYPGWQAPHVVRDERSGDAVFRSHDRDAAETEYQRRCREHIGRAAIDAMLTQVADDVDQRLAFLLRHANDALARVAALEAENERLRRDAGRTPQNVVLNGNDLDRAVDEGMAQATPAREAVVI